MLGLRSRTLSAALPLAVRTTRWPLTPLSPAAIHCRGKHKDRAIECEYMHMLLYKEMQVKHNRNYKMHATHTPGLSVFFNSSVELYSKTLSR